MNFEDILGGRGGASQAGFGGRASAPPREQETEITVSLHEAFHGSTRSLQLSGPAGSKSVDVKIPAGTTDGAKIRLKGEGLLLKIKVSPDPRFEVAGRDLVTDVKLSPAQAALGDKVEVQTMDGTISLTIPAGASSGAKLRI